MPNNKVLTDYYELIAPNQPGSAQFTQDGSEATLDFIMSYDKIPTFCADILGSAQITGNGNLNRQLPLTHPTFSYMAASAISSVQGLGIDGRIEANLFNAKQQMGSTNYNAPQFQATYNKYKLTVNFTTRPYNMLDNNQLAGLNNYGATFNYAKKSKNTVTIASYQEYYEHLRFVTVNTFPAAEVLSNNRGQYYFRTNGGGAGENAPNDGKPISNQNSGSVYLVVPRNIVKVKWFFVPFKMTESLGIKDGVGKVNFGYDFGNTISSGNFFDYGYKFLGYPTGSLLFKNFTISPYSAAIPPNILNADSPNASLQSWMENTYCDIEFEFIEFQIPNDQLGVLPDRTTLSNEYGKIFYGHNMVPYSRNKKYYYIESNQDNSLAWPIYWSYPMQRLFKYI